MSTPVLDRPRAPRQRAARRGTGPRVPTQRQPGRKPTRTPTPKPAPKPTRQTAAQRAYARRDERWRRVHDPASRQPRHWSRLGTRRVAFVLQVMVLCGVGLVATLWLSTAATVDSYRLDAASSQARELSEQSERLRAEVAAMQSPAALAKAATELGMVPTRDVARLVVAPDGSASVVGVPRAIAAPPPPPPPPPVPPPAATPAPPSSGPPGETPAPVPQPAAAQVGAIQPGAVQPAPATGGQ